MNGRWRGLSSSSWYFCDVYMMTKPLRAKMSLLCRMAHIQTKCVIFSKKYIKFQDNNFIIKALYGLEKTNMYLLSILLTCMRVSNVPKPYDLIMPSTMARP